MYWHIDTDIVSLIVIACIYFYMLKMLPKDEPPIRNRRFLICLLVGIFTTVIDIVASVAMEVPVSRFVYHLFMTLYLIAMELMIVAWFYYSLAILYPEDAKRRNRAGVLIAIPYAVYILLVCSNLWNGLFYTLGPNNEYQRGPLFLSMIAVYAGYALALFVLIFARRRHILAGYPKSVLLSTPLILAVSIPVQLMNSGWLMILPSYMICLVLAFLFFQNVRIRDEREQIRSLAEMVEHFACGVGICNISSEGKLDIQYLSNAYAAICEEDNVSLLKRFRADILTGVHPDDKEMVRAKLEESARTLCDHEITYRYITAGGKLKWLNVKASVVRHADGTATVYATYIDLTEQHKLQRQLSDLIHTVPCGICLYRWDGKDLTPLIVNQQLSEMLGEDAKKYLSGIYQLNYTHVHPDDLEELRKAAYLGLTQTGEVDTTYRTLNVKTKEYLWVRMRGIMRAQPDGSQLVYVSYYDVSQEHLAEQKLRESEQALEYAAAQAGLYYWRYDAVNDRAFPDGRNQREYGLPPVMEHFTTEWLPKGAVHPDYWEVYRDACRRIRDGEKQVTFEAQSYAGDGSLHWSRYCLTNLYDGDGNVSITVGTSMIIDTEKELWAKYELERNRKSVDSENLLAHAVFNLTTGDMLEYAYQDGAEVAPENRDAFMFSQKNAGLLIDEEERREFLTLNDKERLLERFAAGETEFTLDYRRRLKDGNIAWVRSALYLVRDPRNADILLFEYWYDIEEEKMLEQTYHSLALNSYDYVARINGRNRHYVTLLKNGLTYCMPPSHGDDADIVTLSLHQEGVSPQDREMVIQNTLVENIKRNLNQFGRFQFTYREIQPDGSLLYKRITQYYLDRQREIILMTREDVTETIRAEAEKNAVLAAALEAANQASKAKSHFLSRVSHELRTPLNAIIGFLELAKGAEMPRVETCLANSDIAAKQLLSIINDVLDMSSIESGKLKLSHAPFNIRQLIQSLSNVYLAQCQQKGLLFEARVVNQTDEWLIGDKLRVNQILLNLLNNAVKFTAEGRITLKISQLATQSNRVLLRFEVSDTGCGMSEKLLERLFTPFEQESAETALKYGGNGLGLSIVKSLVSMMDGEIKVQSKQGEGSTFIIDLPFDKSEENVALESIKGVEDLHVLVVDDEPVEREYLSMVLGRLGVRHTCVKDGNAALDELERAQRAGKRYNICLVDWKMPLMDGVETSRRIRARYDKNMVVIVISAYEHHQADEYARQAGANLFVTKPLFQSSLFDLFMTLTNGRVAKRTEGTKTHDFNGKRVLLAEDNAMNRVVAEGLITRLGVGCEWAENGQIAVNKFLAAAPGYFDAILMDIQMPIMNGLEATRAIRESLHADAKIVPIIALTANAFKEDIDQSLSCGMNDHVAKPIEPETLAGALEKAFQKR